MARPVESGVAAAWESAKADHAATSRDLGRRLALIESGAAAAWVSARTYHAASSRDLLRSHAPIARGVAAPTKVT